MTGVRATVGTRTPSAAVPHALTMADLGELGIERLLHRAEALREARRHNALPRPLAGRQVALLFEKPSLRTRVTFDAGIAALGGHPVFLSPDEVRIGVREKASDIGANLSRWVDAIVLRTFTHATLVEVAATASVPVVNALTDREHPCQALADLLTLRQRFGSLAGRRVSFIGAGNNVSQSFIWAAALAGIHVRVATPPGYELNAALVRDAAWVARRTGATIEIGNDPAAAVRDAEAVYTDVWTSMGEEAEASERRRRFAGFRVDEELLAGAPDAIVMHCLPAHRGEEISAEVLDGPRSVALDQAENRLYVQQALLVELLDVADR